MRHDSCMDAGRLHLQPKRQYQPFDDCTSTMAYKKTLMEAGITLDRPINYTPAHRRTARGIVAGIIGGTLIWIFVLITAWAIYRVVTL